MASSFSWKGQEIRVRPDGFLSAADLGRRTAKQFHAWYTSDPIKRYLARAGAYGLELVDRRGGILGSYLHPVLAVRFGEWLDVELGQYLREKVGMETIIDFEGRFLNSEERGFVYFIQMENSQFFKFGFSQNPKSRLYSLQAGNPELLSLIKCYPAPPRFETQVHNFFIKERRRGEWYPLEIYDDFVNYVTENLKLLRPCA